MIDFCNSKILNFGYFHVPVNESGDRKIVYLLDENFDPS